MTDADQVAPSSEDFRRKVLEALERQLPTLNTLAVSAPTAKGRKRAKQLAAMVTARQRATDPHGPVTIIRVDRHGNEVAS